MDVQTIQVVNLRHNNLCADNLKKSHNLVYNITMNDKQNEPKLIYALDESGKMVYIRNVVERGLACKCRCPKCNTRIRGWFFDPL